MGKFWSKQVGIGKFKLPRWMWGVLLIIDLVIADPLPIIDEVLLLYFTFKK